MDNIYCSLCYTTDESVRDLNQINLQAMLQTFRSIPWQNMDSVVEIEICSGPEAENGNMFIVGQYDNGTFWLDLRTYIRGRFLGIIPYKKTADVHISSASANEVEDYITKFFEYPQQHLFEWIKIKQKSQKEIEEAETVRRI